MFTVNYINENKQQFITIKFKVSMEFNYFKSESIENAISSRKLSITFMFSD